LAIICLGAATIYSNDKRIAFNCLDKSSGV